MILCHIYAYRISVYIYIHTLIQYILYAHEIKPEYSRVVTFDLNSYSRPRLLVFHVDFAACTNFRIFFFYLRYLLREWIRPTSDPGNLPSTNFRDHSGPATDGACCVCVFIRVAQLKCRNHEKIIQLIGQGNLQIVRTVTSIYSNMLIDHEDMISLITEQHLFDSVML